MKKTFKKLLLVPCVIFFAESCTDEFLDQEPQSNIITSSQLGEAVEVNPTLGEATVTGIYATMFTVGSGGSTSQQDFGQKTYDIYGDYLSGDMALSLSSFGWWTNTTELQSTQDFTFGDNRQGWRYYYRIINLSNLVIESLGGNDANPDDEDIRALLGQAFAMRGHSYFYLTQFYIDDIGAAWTQPTLPIYTESGFEGNPKSTTEEVYNLIEDDLNKAINFLQNFSRTAKTQVDLSVAQTILAYALASRRDRWADVANLTADAITNSSATPMDVDLTTGPQTPTSTANDIRGGFNDVNANGWMWGVDLNADIGLGLISWWGHIDAFSFSYAGFGDNKAMDIGLYESMPPDDIRREQFFNNPASTNHLQPFFKFYDSDRVFRGSAQIVKADYIYMRIEEPILLNIEALAKSGQEAAARTALESFVAARLTGGDASYVAALSGQALLDEIYKQTRLELWGEGKAYLALKRNMGTVTRGSNHLALPGTVIPFDDNRLTFEIPQSEIQNNNNINDQN